MRPLHPSAPRAREGSLRSAVASLNLVPSPALSPPPRVTASFPHRASSDLSREGGRRATECSPQNRTLLCGLSGIKKRAL